MSVMMQDVWAAQERYAGFRRTAQGRRQIVEAHRAGRRQTMADRISGIKARVQFSTAGLSAAWRQHLSGGHPVAEA